MRELKFRIWDNEKKMFSPNPTKEMLVTNESYWITKYEVLVLSGTNEKKISFYTGFKDKNSLDIFEGDILEVAGGSKITVDDMAEFLIFCGKYEEKHGVELFPSVQVSGNIYEVNND